jgi:hypothetical protein
MTRLAICALFALSLLCCATTKPAEKKNPLPHEAGKPLQVSILGAQYTLQPRIEVDDHSDEPGMFLFTFVDRVTRCEGYMLFQTVGVPSIHEKYVADKTAILRAEWETQQVVVTPQPSTVKVLDADGRVTIFELAKAEVHARAALFDRHVVEQNLSVLGYTFCEDPGLIQSQLQALAEVVNSQKR